MTLKQFRDLLLTVTDRVGHGEHFKDGGNYIVWHEVGKSERMLTMQKLKADFV